MKDHIEIAQPCITTLIPMSAAIGCFFWRRGTSSVYAIPHKISFLIAVRL